MWVQLLLCLLIIVLIWSIKDEKKRIKYILPLSFILVATFFAIRFDYGNDYWHYYERWDSGRLVEGENRGTGETLFYQFMQLFDYYYKFVIAHTLLFCTILFYLVRRHLAPSYYILFFLMFMSMSTMSYNMMSAMRSTMSACILWLALDLFYIQKKKWLLYMVSVALASFFHTSALIFLILPFVDKIFNNIKPRILFFTFIIGMILNVLIPKEIFTIILSLSDTMSDTYGGYLDSDKASGSTFFGMLNRSILLFPYYFVCIKKDSFQNEKKRIWILGMFIILLISYGIDLDGRFSIVLYIFFVFTLANTLPLLNKNQKKLCLAPLLFSIAFNNIYLFYKMQLLYFYTDANNFEGCFLYYKTIFDAPYLP